MNLLEVSEVSETDHINVIGTFDHKMDVLAKYNMYSLNVYAL